MRDYSVAQIAAILDTTPDTVRRWIRNRDLIATQKSRKNGNVISETELRRFLSEHPKYQRHAAFSPVLRNDKGYIVGHMYLDQAMKDIQSVKVSEADRWISDAKESVRRKQAEVDEMIEKIRLLNDEINRLNNDIIAIQAIIKVYRENIDKE